MLASLYLDSFKAFGIPTDITLAPITLVYGENSAGKSSITQSILLLKQTIESRTPGMVLAPRLDGGLVDLGSFPEMVFDHDLSRSLTIGLKPSRKKKKERDAFRLDDSPLLGEQSLRFKFRMESTASEIEVESIIVWSEEINAPVAEFKPGKYSQPNSMYFENSVMRPVSPADSQIFACSYLTDHELLWRPSYAYVKANIKKVLLHIDDISKDLEKRGAKARPLLLVGRGSDGRDAGNKYWSNFLREILEFLSTDFSLEQWIAFFRPRVSTQKAMVNGFIPYGREYPWRTYDIIFDVEQKVSGGGFDVWGVLPDPVKLLVRLAHKVDRLLDDVFPLGPFRRAPERYYIYTGSSPSDVGYSGNLAPDLLFRNKNLRRLVNTWLERLDVGYEIRVKTHGKAKDLFELRLFDTRRNKTFDASVTDVGFGISQLLPFVVQSLAKKNQIITIEQPEVHIHPRLQADVGELIADSYKRFANQFIVETHSEHLVLRIQKLIHDGRLSPNDVSVIYVSRGHKGSSVESIRFAPDGYLLDEWPGGFFPERLREVF